VGGINFPSNALTHCESPVTSPIRRNEMSKDGYFPDHALVNQIDATTQAQAESVDINVETVMRIFETMDAEQTMVLFTRMANYYFDGVEMITNMDAESIANHLKWTAKLIANRSGN
jgi:hypothetical protein